MVTEKERKLLKWLGSKWTFLVCLIAITVLLGVNGITVSSTDTGETVITLGHVAYAAGTVDYQFDGVDDDVQFQAALNALPATGGRLVCVSATTINFSATVSRAIDDVVIEGSGFGTYFANDGGTSIFDAGVQDGWVFSDLSTDAGGVDVGTATNYKLENVVLGATYYPLTVSGELGLVDATLSGNLTATGLEAPTGRGATYTIAANDSPAWCKAQADYLCPGTADEVMVDTANQALDTAGGGTLHFFPGTYTAANYPFIWGGNNTDTGIIWQGEGINTKFTQANGANLDAIIQTRGGYVGTFVNFNIKIKDVMVDGNRDNNTGDTHGIYLTAYQSTISGCTIKQCDGDGIFNQGISSGENGVDNRYLDLMVYNNDGEGLHWESSNPYSPDPIIQACKIFYNGESGIQYSGGDLFVSACSVYGNGDNQIYIIGNAWGEITGNWIGSNQNGIYLQSGGSYSTQRMQIIGNSLYINNSGTPVSKDGIVLWDGSSGAGSYPVIDCSIIGNNFASYDTDGRYGVRFYGTANCTMIGNTFTGTWDEEVYYQGTNAGNIVCNNAEYITENSGTTTLPNGSTDIAVEHGLDVTPDPEKFHITPLENPTNAITLGVADNCTATHFWIIGDDPGASNCDVGWSYSDYP